MQYVKGVTRSLSVLGASAVMLVCGAFSAQATASETVLEARLVAVCQAIKNDNRLALHKAVKKSNVSYHRLAKGLRCNGGDMYSFAVQHNASKTGALIARRTNLDERTLTAQN